MAVDLDDFRNVNENITPAEFEKFIDSIGPYSDCNDTHMFIQLAPILNKFERKGSTPDSLRKWVTDRLNELIEILKKTPLE